MKNRINLRSHFPIMDIQNNIVFANNGNVVVCYQLELPEIYSLSDSDFDEIHSLWFQAFKGLPHNTIIHRQDIYLKQNFSSETFPNKSFLERATQKYFKGREYLSHSAYLFFILPLDKTLNASKYVNPFRKSERNLQRKLDITVAQFLSSVNEVSVFINNSKRISLKPLSQKKILEYTEMYFNGFNHGFDTDIILNKKHIEIGDYLFDALTVNSEQCFGSSVQSSRANKLFASENCKFRQGFLDGFALDLNDNHLVNQIIYLDDKHKWRKHIDRRIDELKKSSNFGSQNRVILKKMENLREEVNSDENSRIIRGNFNIVFWAHEAVQLKQIASNIKSEFKDLDIIPYYPRGDERKHIFLNSYPPFTSNYSNEDLYVTDLKHALCLYINNTNYKSDPQGILFNDRQFNLPIKKDVWDESKKRIKARNFAIFAPTGEGKSFLANNILRQYFEEGIRLVVIDLGGSYSKFAKLYPDQSIVLRYEYGKNLGINPFYISDSTDLTPEQLEDLSIFLLELLADGDVSKGKQVAMKKVLLHYYNSTIKEHSLQSLFRFVDNSKDTLLNDLHINEDHFSVYDFLHILSEYIEGGLYSFLFNVEKDQTYKIENKQLIIFELDEVKDNKEILSVMLKLIKSAIQRTIWRNRSEKGIVLFDEFAKQLKFPNVLESVEFYYQAIRKQNGAIGVILQSINQLPLNSTSASILENTQVIYSLRNEKGYEDLRNRLNLSEHDLNQLKSIRNNLLGDHKYTEIFIKIGKDSNIYRLEVPPEVYAAYLTDGQESEEIMQLYEENYNMEEAITKFVSKTVKS